MRRLCWLLLTIAPLAAQPYQLGLNLDWAPNLSVETRQGWVSAAGCTMPRVGVRSDLWTKPGGEGHADATVRYFLAQGATPLLFLFNGTPRTIRLPDGREAKTLEPEGLREPVFTSGGDYPRDGDRLNPANRWAAFVGAIVARYSPDDSGRQGVRWFSLWNEPDWLPWPQRPERADTLPTWPGAGYDRLARLLFVSHAAARFADRRAKIGLQLCFPESLRFLLEDRAHPAGGNLDFVDYHAYGGDGSDANVFLNEGLAPLARAYREELRRHYLRRDLLCSETGVGAGADERVQRAAVPKTQLVGAALGLVTAQWYTLFDPSWKSMGLIRDVRGLPADGAGWQPRDGYYAYLSLARLLGPGLAGGQARFVDEVTIGEGARCYRFTLDGHELLAAWAWDPDGRAERTAEVTLPLQPGVRYGRYHWDYCLTGRPDEALTGAADGGRVKLGIDPEYFYAGEDRTLAPVARPAPPPPAPWRATASGSDERWPADAGFDGNPDTHWTGGWGQATAWWRLDFADGPATGDTVRLKLGRLPEVTAVVEVSADGEVWRAVSAPFTSTDYSLRAVPLTGRVTSARWRVRFEKPANTNVTLYEAEFGERRGGTGR